MSRRSIFKNTYESTMLYASISNVLGVIIMDLKMIESQSIDLWRASEGIIPHVCLGELYVDHISHSITECRTLSTGARVRHMLRAFRHPRQSPLQPFLVNPLYMNCLTCLLQAPQLQRSQFQPSSFPSITLS